MTGLIISMTGFGLSKTFSSLVVRYSKDPFAIPPSLIPPTVVASPVCLTGTWELPRA